MARTPIAPTLNNPEPGILSKSGLDITLENIGERLNSIDKKLDNAPTKEKVQQLEDDVSRAQDDLVAQAKKHSEEIARLSDQYADKKSFELVQKLVFGAVAIILVGVVGGLLSLVLK